MSKHTPGPYERDGNTVYATVPCTKKPWEGQPCNKWSAQVQSQNGADGASPEECEAVARIFQFAPKMLETLIQVLNIAEKDTPGTWDDVIAIIRPITAKAQEA